MGRVGRGAGYGYYGKNDLFDILHCRYLARVRIGDEAQDIGSGGVSGFACSEGWGGLGVYSLCSWIVLTSRGYF